eukprot:EG_transcript_8765
MVWGRWLGLWLAAAQLCAAAPVRPRGGAAPGCDMRWHNQTVDHFAWESPGAGSTFMQRYCVSDQYWRPTGPIFFYAGNEGPVETYIANTGLMWESAPRFAALVVFAEHRYYGASQVCGPDSWRRCPRFLTAEQAMADYAALVTALQRSLRSAVPVVLFGGSYGGMLAAWLRLKYPHLFAGAIAASAPVWAFPNIPGRPWDPSAYWAIVTRDATAAAGAAPDCAAQVAAAFEDVSALGASAEGRRVLRRVFRLCEDLAEEAVEALRLWLLGAFDSLAMGNYPFASAYISGDPALPLPPWPMRVACARLHGVGGPGPEPRLAALREAVAVLYNVSGAARCYSLAQVGPAAGADDIWDYQFCTELLPQEVPYFPVRGPPSDMFWPQQPWTAEDVARHCRKAHGVEPRADWMAVTYGDLSAASNIVFSYGEFDPWSAGCVRTNLSASVVALLVPEGAHHLDLMFATPQDPPGVAEVREAEMRHVEQWVRSWKR